MTATYPHDHREGLFLQPMPECLAPRPKDRAARPDLAMPRPGDMVVIQAATVTWINPINPDRPLTPDSVVMYGATMHGRDRCEGAGWTDGLDLGPLDPDFPGIDEEDEHALRAALTLLTDHANVPAPTDPKA